METLMQMVARLLTISACPNRDPSIFTVVLASNSPSAIAVHLIHKSYTFSSFLGTDPRVMLSLYALIMYLVGALPAFAMVFSKKEMSPFSSTDLSLDDVLFMLCKN